LNDWFEAVKERRKNPDMKPIDSYEGDGPMMRNQILDELTGAKNG
jgi:hypothetical protein